MTVYVDELRKYPYAKIAFFRQGACHMTADSHEELVAFAVGMGLKASWIQKEGTLLEHFDLTSSRRTVALARGAVFRPAREWAAQLRLKREQE